MTTLTAPTKAPPADERVARTGVVTRILRRPEFGALIGAVAVFVLFAVTDQTGKFASMFGLARWTDSASTIGIVAVAVALLMIGGEFDLSAGVMVGSSGLVLGVLVTQLGLPVWPAIALTLRLRRPASAPQRLARDEDALAQLHRHARRRSSPSRASTSGSPS